MASTGVSRYPLPMAEPKSQLPVRIRRALAADARVLAELGARTFRDTFWRFNRAGDMELFLEKHYGEAVQRHELEDPRATFWIAELHGAAIGFALTIDAPPLPALVGKRTIELARLYVEQGYLGSGVGALLLERCIDQARELGCESIWLGVWERNHRALAFYRRNGFLERGEHDFWLGTDRQRDLIVERMLVRQGAVRSSRR